MFISAVSGYARTQAVVRALYSQMLLPETWTALIHAESLDDLLNVLSKTVYGPYLELDRRLLTPRRTAYQIRQHLTYVYEKIIRIAPASARPLLVQLYLLFEVDNLKAILRGIEAGASWEQVRHLLWPTQRYVTLEMDDLERMVRTESVVRAVQRIRGTPYYDTLVYALERYEMEQTLFPLEVALDLDYRRELWTDVQALSGTDHEQALRLVGTILDVDNLLWAIRYRIYHHLSEEEIINYTLPSGYRVEDEDIRALAAGANPLQVVREVYPEIEGWDSLTASSPARQLEAIEFFLQRHVIELCRKTFVGAPFHIGLPMAYLQLNEYEIKDLTMLIEAKASRVPVETFGPLLELYPRRVER